jgi:ribonuclease BN (tRNA processing enzyme)
MKNEGITVRILGDSGPFSKAGKSIGYMVTIGESNYLIDCGAQLFQQIGGDGLKKISGLIITHCHDDHKRWFTDFVMFYRYAPDIEGKIPLYTSEDVMSELLRMAEPALDRTLSDDQKRVIDVPCSAYVDFNLLGPRAKYRIVSDRSDRNGVCYSVVDSSGSPVGPDRAKIVISSLTGRPRLLFRDPDSGEWVEPESYYPYSSEVFYESSQNVLEGPEGFVIEAVKAPVWHGLSNIGIKISNNGETLIFSSDTVHDVNLWEELYQVKHSQKLSMSPGEFESASIIYGDINDYIERTWSEERFREAVNAYRDAVVIHDVSVRDSVVHTSYNRLNRTTLNKEKTILTHSPDRITSLWALCSPEKHFRITGCRYYEIVENELYPMNADVYHKERGRYYVGYKSDDGPYAVYENNGMHHLCPSDETCEGRLLFRVDMYEDVAGRYVPRVERENSFYRLRSDGKVELVTENENGSIGTVVENNRKYLVSRQENVFAIDAEKR